MIQLKWLIPNLKERLDKLESFVLENYGFNYLKPFDKILRNKIRGKRVLVVGSGESFYDFDFKKIPKDVLVFTCNNGIELLRKNKFGGKICLYLTSKFHIKNYYGNRKGLFKLFKNERIDFFIANDLGKTNYILNVEERINRKIMSDDGRNNYYLNKVTYPFRIIEEVKKGYNYCSNGLKLVQLALFFDAKEVYLIGIDGYGKNIYGVKNTKQFCHYDMDKGFLENLKTNANYSNKVFLISNKSNFRNIVNIKELK